MTTDERLDRLAERHGALAESLQLLTADVHGLTAKHGALAESLQLLTADVQSLAQSVKETAKQHDQTFKEHDQILRGHADLIGDLARIASAHEQRVQRLESREG
jgi:predicted nuclease with TOPRIM domain